MITLSRQIARTIPAILLLLALSALPGRTSEAPESKPGAGDVAPIFVVNDIEGQKVALDEIVKSGKVVLLNFWGVRCSSCIEEIGYLNPLYEKYGSKGIVFLGVNVDGIKADILKKQMPVMAHKPIFTVLPDPEFKIPDMFNLAGAPLSFVIGKDGIIKYRHEDFKPGDEKGIEEAIRKALDGN